MQAFVNIRGSGAATIAVFWCELEPNRAPSTRRYVDISGQGGDERDDGVKIDIRPPA
jgi:hypothetical protein